MKGHFTYNLLNRPATLSENGYNITLDYDASCMRRHTVITNGQSLVKEKTRISDLYELEATPTSSRRLDYIYAEGRIVAVHVDENSTGSLYYVLTDHLGSWTTVTNRNGLVVQDVRFNPWGTPYYSDSTTLTQASSLLFDRGFTGHEHLMRYGLINMNGRVYDPVTSTFLSVDNYVQDPSSTQNFNRYAYCLNNPLKYVDPDGESILATISMIIGAAVCAYIGGTAANGWNYNPCSWSWDGKTWAGIGIGAIAGVAAGAAFACAAPALASTPFMAHFGASGVMTSYTLSGFASLGAGGYVAGFGGGMLYSNGDTHYSHLSGVQGFKVGATVGSLAGQLAGDLVAYKPPKKQESITVNPRDKWDGCYYKGTNEEFRQMMVETSKYFGVETKGYSTSRGYYFEPIAGDIAYRICDIPLDEYCIYTSFEDKIFRYNLDYNCTVMDEGPYMNGFDYCYRYTKMYADREGRLYIYPEGNSPAQIYAAYHTHPRNSYEGKSDMNMIFYMGVNGVIFGWNGCKHYYYPPW